MVQTSSFSSSAFEDRVFDSDYLGLTQALLAKEPGALETDGDLDLEDYRQWLIEQGLWLLVVWHCKEQVDACPLVNRLYSLGLGELRGGLIDSLHRDAALEGLLSLLRRHAVEALVIKGAVLERLIYPEPYLRPRCDTDLFINEDCAETLHRILRADGYQFVRASEHSFVTCCFNYFKQSPNHGMHFDIHWKIHNDLEFRDAIPFGDAYARARYVGHEEAYFCRFDDMDLAIHACLTKAGGFLKSPCYYLL